MFQRKIRAGVLIVWGIATLGATPNSADAGLLDRLFPLRAQRRAQRQALRQAQRLSEATTAYYPVTTAVGRNGRVCGQPVQQQVVVRYMPQVRYRTVWASVPVTVYRPTTSSNPATGCTVTCMRPCTTYTWQARRVPYTAYQPLYTTYTTVAVTTPAPVILGGQYSTASYTQGGAFALGYANGSAFSPSGSIGVGCSGCAPAASSTVVPYSGPFVQTPPPASSTLIPMAPANPAPLRPVPGAAADRAPTLAPRDLPGAQRGLPTNGSNTETESSTRDDAGTNPSTGAPSANSASPFDGSGALNTTTGPTKGNPYLKPIPDPNRRQNSWKSDGVPRLLDPRDQTALRPRLRRWAAIPISWAAPPKRSIDEPFERAEQAKQDAMWDDTGWRASSL